MLIIIYMDEIKKYFYLKISKLFDRMFLNFS